MGIGIVMLILGLIFILLPRTEWYKDYIENHNFTDQEEVQGFIRNIVGVIFIILGIIAFVLYFSKIISHKVVLGIFIKLL